MSNKFRIPYGYQTKNETPPYLLRDDDYPNEQIVRCCTCNKFVSWRYVYEKFLNNVTTNIECPHCKTVWSTGH